MGFDLTGKGGYFRWNGGAWRNVLALGLAYGWQPLGTGPRRGTQAVEWEGGYGSNDGQLFKARDGKHLADALERALVEFPGFRSLGDAASSERWAWFCTDERKAALEQLVVFLRAGSFRLF